MVKKNNGMQAYSIQYQLKGKDYSAIIDAKDARSAKRKIGKKHGYKDGRMIRVTSLSIIGYY
jgi:hypothetical protein